MWDLLCPKACQFHYLRVCKNDCREKSSEVFLPEQKNLNIFVH